VLECDYGVICCVILVFPKIKLYDFEKLIFSTIISMVLLWKCMEIIELLFLVNIFFMLLDFLWLVCVWCASNESCIIIESLLMMGNNLKISRNNTHKLKCLVLNSIVEVLHVRDR